MSRFLSHDIAESRYDDDLPPVVVDPVRRDPSLGIRPQEFEPPRAEPPAPAGGRTAIAIIAVILGVAAALVLLGLVLHELSRAIMFGWGLG